MTVNLSDDAYRKLVLEVAAARGMQEKTAKPRRRFGLGGCLIWTFCLAIGAATLIGVSLNIVAKLGIARPAIPPALIDAFAGKEQTIYSTPVGQQRPPVEAPIFSGSLYRATATPYPRATPWPTEKAAPTPTLDPAPYTTQPNLGPSNPESNPGFSCGVEPGMDTHATCEGVDPEAEPNVYSVEGRVFQPMVLPTSSVSSNPGFDSSVEPWDMPTPIQ